MVDGTEKNPAQHIDTFAAWKDAPDWPGTREDQLEVT
jgi:hypothetical protein